MDDEQFRRALREEIEPIRAGMAEVKGAQIGTNLQLEALTRQVAITNGRVTGIEGRERLRENKESYEAGAAAQRAQIALTRRQVTLLGAVVSGVATVAAALAGAIARFA